MIEMIVAEEQHIYWQNRSDLSPRVSNPSTIPGKASSDRKGEQDHGHS